MYTMNRFANATNPFQGDFKKVLTVCSAGLLRSPTAAIVLSQEPFNFNTRACGLDEDFALIPIDDVLLAWADEVVCMTRVQEEKLKTMTHKSILCLEIPDAYSYRDPELMQMIKDKYSKLVQKNEH